MNLPLPVLLAVLALPIPARSGPLPADLRDQGVAAAAAGRWAAAVPPLEQLIRETPTSADATVWRTLALAYLKQSRPGDAINAADRGLKALGDDALLLQTKADALARMRRSAESADAALRAEKLMWKSGAPAGKTAVMPPFAGTWKVLAGPGDDSHTGLAARWAWDFVKIDDKGLDQDPRARDKRRNESYYSWDQPVQAPAAGEVVFVESGVADNILSGTANDRFPPGNHLVIRHGTGEFSFLGHLKKGSISVKPGDAVAAGQVVARSGNSGIANQPQVHFSLLSSWDPAVCVMAAFPVAAGQPAIQPKRTNLVTGSDPALLPIAASPAGSSTLAALTVSATAIAASQEKPAEQPADSKAEQPADSKAGQPTASKVEQGNNPAQEGQPAGPQAGQGVPK